MSWFGDYVGRWFGSWFGGESTTTALPMSAAGACGATGQVAMAVRRRRVGSSRPRRPLHHRRPLEAAGSCGATGRVAAGVIAAVHVEGRAGASGQAVAAVASAARSTGTAATAGQVSAGCLVRVAATGRSAPAARLRFRVRNDEAELLAIIAALDHDRRAA